MGKLFSASAVRGQHAMPDLHVATRRLLDGTKSIGHDSVLLCSIASAPSTYTSPQPRPLLRLEPAEIPAMEAVGYVAAAHLSSLKNTRLAALRPPGEFFDWQRVSKPANSGEFMKRAGYNM